MKKRESKGKQKGSRSSSPTRTSVGEGSPKSTGLSDKENQPSCCAFKQGECQKRNASDYWQSPQHLISPQQEKYVAQIQSGGSLLHGVSGRYSSEIYFTENREENCEKVPKKSHTLCFTTEQNSSRETCRISVRM